VFSSQLPSTWQLRELSEIATVSSGNGAPQDPKYFDRGKYPFVRVHDLGRCGKNPNLIETVNYVNDLALKEQRLRIFPKDTILFPKSGVSTLLNHRAILGRDACVVGHLAAVNANEKIVLTKWLYYYLIIIDFSSWVSATTLPSLPLSRIKTLQVPVPPLAIQKILLDILVKTDQVKQKREQANQMTNKILQAVFLRMFGDPAANPQKWGLVSFGTLIKESRNGFGRRRKPGEKGGYIVLRIQDIQKGEIDTEDLNTIPMTDSEIEKYRLLPNDILFVRVNGNIELVGKVALFNLESHEMAFNDHIVRLRVNKSEVESTFLKYFLETNYARTEIKRRAVTSAGQFSVGQHRLATLSVPLPPLSLQRQFGVIVQKTKILQKNQAGSTQTIKQLFNSLLSKAFKGEQVCNISEIKSLSRH
jgi:restriction endonuclease S subunit